jgi:putative SOS response-associated peptidase YedK
LSISSFVPSLLVKYCDGMCGRYTLHTRDRIELKRLHASGLPFEPRYNIAPSQLVMVIGNFGRGVEARFLSWGLIPSWSTEGKAFINARSETLEERPSFNESFRFRRCLIPANGFFEWKRSGREKRPFYIQARDEDLLFFAGIWDSWSFRGEIIMSCAIITTPANQIVGELHDRMPAILLPKDHDAWLDPQTNRVALLQMLRPFPASETKIHPVGSSVNSTANDSAELLRAVDFEVGQTLSLF